MDDLIERLRRWPKPLNLEVAAALEAALEDAERYRWLRAKFAAADFHPEDPEGLDLGVGVALIFMLTSGSHVTPDLNWTIDQARGKGGAGK